MKRIFLDNPILFKGARGSKKYFEGWYFKQVSGDGKVAISLIPGISINEDECHSFIQIIVNLSEDDSNSELRNITFSKYYKYSYEEFSFSSQPFFIKIGDNLFSEDKVIFSIDDGIDSLICSFELGKFKKIKKSLIMPNIMGFFGYFSFMECNHGLISMRHEVDGRLVFNNNQISLNKGRGYIEKDWGKSFPESYLWLQSNHFEKNVDFFCSVARIPFLGTTFQGLICVLNVDNHEYRFATYNGSKFKIIDISNNSIKMIISRRNLRLEIEGVLDGFANLKAPQKGEMSKAIKEGLSGLVSLKLICNKKGFIYKRTGYNNGKEIII